MKINRPTVAICAFLLAVTASVAAITSASGDTTTTAADCSTQANALACVEGLRQYVLAHPDATPTETPTTVPPTTVPPTTAPPTTTVPVTVPPTTVPPTTAPVSIYASGLPWSSGVWAAQNAATVGAFATMRGRAVDNILAFPTRDSWAQMLNTWYLSSSVIPADFTGDIILAVPLWPQNSDVTTNADANWKTFASALAAKDPNAYVRLGWEMNIGQYWKVTAANRTAWIAAFNRAALAMHSVAPQLRIVFNPNWGNDQTDTDSRGVFQAVKANVAVYGIDMYDSYPPDTSDANANARLSGPRALADSLNYAAGNAKQFALPEWGVGCNISGCAWQGNAGGDNPRYINDTLAFLGAHRLTVAFDTYFNEPATYIRSNLYPTTTNPSAAAAYRTDLTALAS